MNNTRLNRAAVESGIKEMWDALLSTTQGEGYQEAVEQARQCEQRLRARLDAQDRLDAAAPALLEACKAALKPVHPEGRAALESGQCTEIDCLISMMEEAIAKAEGTHEKQNP